MRSRKIFAIVLTHATKFAEMAKTLQWLSYLDYVLILVPHGQKKMLDQMLECLEPGKIITCLPDYDVVEHGVWPMITPAGLIKSGELKFEQFSFMDFLGVQPGDLCIMMDDDIKRVQGVDMAMARTYLQQEDLRKHLARVHGGTTPWKDLPESVRRELREEHGLVKFAFNLDRAEFRQRMLDHATEIERLGGGYGTVIYAPMSHDSRRKGANGRYTRSVTFNGFLEVTYGQANPYNMHLRTAEDYAAAGHILADLQRPLILDTLTSVGMDCNMDTYRSEGPIRDERIKTIDQIVNQFHHRGTPVFRKSKTQKSSVPGIAVTRRVQAMIQQETYA